MSTLDKFKNHKTAYLLTGNGLIPEYENISEVDIISVGRKYVTITNNVKFAESGYERNCLIEQVNCGWSRYLFAVKRDVLDYVEKRQIVAWLAKSKSLLGDVSLESLRRVKSIIEGDLKIEKKEEIKSENSDLWGMYHRGDIVCQMSEMSETQQKVL